MPRIPLKPTDVADSIKNVAKSTTDAAKNTANYSVDSVKRTLLGIGDFISHGVEKASAPLPKFFSNPGQKPGIEHILEAEEEHGPVPVKITCIDYGPSCHNSMEVHDLDEFLEAPRPGNVSVRWLNIDGLSAITVDKLQKKFRFHLLAAEDVMNVYQRPKVEDYQNHLFLVARQLRLESEKLINEQLSIFLFKDMLITFQEAEGDVFDPVRERLHRDNSRFRNSGPDYLLYTLLDCIIDHLFPLCERYGNAMEELEEAITVDPKPSAQQKLFSMKRDLSALRRQVWPTRELLLALDREESPVFQVEVKTFMRDVYDHCVQAIDVIESYRETASGLNDLYQTAVANRMNEVMKVLTIMASFFIPITFVAGVYGMNFEHIPELGFEYSYFIFWGVCISITVGLFLFFYRKGWIGGGK